MIETGVKGTKIKCKGDIGHVQILPLYQSNIQKVHKKGKYDLMARNCENKKMDQMGYCILKIINFVKERERRGNQNC